MSYFMFLDLKSKKLTQNGAGSVLIGIISYLKTKLPILKKHLFMRKDIALTRVCLAKYLLSAPLEVQ